MFTLFLFLIPLKSTGIQFWSETSDTVRYAIVLFGLACVPRSIRGTSLRYMVVRKKSLFLMADTDKVINVLQLSA